MPFGTIQWSGKTIAMCVDVVFDLVIVRVNLE